MVEKLVITLLDNNRVLQYLAPVYIHTASSQDLEVTFKKSWKNKSG